MVNKDVYNSPHTDYELRRSRGGGRKIFVSSPKFLFVGKFSPKKTALKPKCPILRNFKGKFEILSIHDLPRQKFADVCLKIATSCSTTF